MSSPEPGSSNSGRSSRLQQLLLVELSRDVCGRVSEVQPGCHTSVVEDSNEDFDESIIKFRVRGVSDLFSFVAYHYNYHNKRKLEKKTTEIVRRRPCLANQ